MLHYFYKLQKIPQRLGCVARTLGDFGISICESLFHICLLDFSCIVLITLPKETVFFGETAAFVVFEIFCCS